MNTRSTKTIYYFGNEVIRFGSTVREVLYTNTGQRYAWEWLKRDIANGEKVVVKEATPYMREIIKLYRKIK